MSESRTSTHQNPVIVESTFTLPHPVIRLRALRESDLLSLEWHGGENLRSFDQKQWMHHQVHSVLVIVADFNHYPVAQAAIHWFGKPTNPEIPDIQSVRVMPAFQGQGIGSKLLEKCESTVRAQGYPQVGLGVGLENKGARRLYERLNYRVI